MTDKKIKPEWIIFIDEYVVCRNATRSYKKAYPHVKTTSAGVEGHRLLKTPKVKDEIDRRLKEISDSAKIRAEDVLVRLWDAATADTNELVEVNRNCCRYCYGDDHAYQYTPAEYKKAVEDIEPTAWYNAKLPPVDGCPECHGYGVENMIIKDTRYLSPAAKQLYAGAKVTQNGIEIKTHDRDRNIELVGKFLAMFVDRTDLSSKDGSMKPMTLDQFYATNTKPKST